MLYPQINNTSIYPLNADELIDKFSTPIIKEEKTEVDIALEILDKLSGAELKRFKELFDKKYNEVVQLDCNYPMHDYIDNYLYIVYFKDGTHHLFSKGEDAYDTYSRCGVRLERKTKDLFPIYETLLEKEYVRPYRKNQKSKKEITKMKKKEYDIQYQKDNIKQIKFTLNKSIDQDILTHLDKQKNKNGYLKELIRKDIKKVG